MQTQAVNPAWVCYTSKKIMNTDRIYNRLETINISLQDIECKIESSITNRDIKELTKKQTKLLKERNKLKRRLQREYEQ